ncbi:MAG: hypothetical protein NTY30_01295 [Candidatus Berkelbacteria bacterium]|nr:hypothetical protein [Candidatus Berkelbacteria bacterium]
MTKIGFADIFAEARKREVITMPECRVALLIGDIYEVNLPEPFTRMADVFQYKECSDVEEEVLVSADDSLVLKIKAFSFSQAGEIVQKYMSDNTDSFVLANAESTEQQYSRVVRRLVREKRGLIVDPIINFKPHILVAGQTVFFEELVVAVANGSSCGAPQVIRFSSFYGESKGYTNRTASDVGYGFDMIKDLDMLAELVLDAEVLRSAISGYETFADAIDRFNQDLIGSGSKPITTVVP